MQAEGGAMSALRASALPLLHHHLLFLALTWLNSLASGVPSRLSVDARTRTNLSPLRSLYSCELMSNTRSMS